MYCIAIGKKSCHFQISTKLNHKNTLHSNTNEMNENVGALTIQLFCSSDTQNKCNLGSCTIFPLSHRLSIVIRLPFWISDGLLLSRIL